MRSKIQKIVNFFDRAEDRARAHLSHYPIFYALIGGVGVVLFWRGVWHTADTFSYYLASPETSLTLHQVLDGPMSLVAGTLILLISGVFVTAFIGNKLIISGLIGEKKLSEKVGEEIETEEAQIKKLQEAVTRLEKKVEHIDEDIEDGKLK